MPMGMHVTADERDAEESGQASQESGISSKMYFYGREFCFILALLFTSYAALQNAPPKVSKSPVPVRFFPRTSLVADFYYGQLSSAFERVAESDVSFVMYYAPWDSESQITKSQFSSVAQYYYKQVYFAAINCWQPQGECRQQFSKIQQFPVLIAYTQHTKGIQYKGVKDAAHMIKFLQSIVQPLTRLEQPDELVDMMASHDAMVVGFYEFSGNVGSPGFHTFYSVSLKFLERDPQREVGFAVVTNEKAAARFGVLHLPAVRIYLWNETLEYSRNAEYSVEELTKWISHSIHQVSVWVSPPGVKSLTLSPYVEKGSVLLLFTPRNPLLTHNYYYDLMRELGLEYYNCDKNPWVSDLSSHITRRRSENNQELMNLNSFCQTLKHELRLGTQRRTSIARSPWTNSSQCRSQAQCYKSCSGGVPVYSDLDSVEGVPLVQLEECSGIDPFVQQPFLELRESHTTLCGCDEEFPETSNHTVLSMSTSMLTGVGDERSIASLVNARTKERCKQWQWAKTLHRPALAKPSEVSSSEERTDFRGLACRTNQTVSLLAMDTLQFHQFAEGLGLDVLAFPDKTAAVIFNAELESTYILDSPLTRDSLLDFMLNYTKGLLRRNLRNSPRIHSTSLNQYPELKVENCTSNESEVCIHELTSSSFHDLVLASEQNVVLMYHSSYCAFCHSVSHMYLTVARYFRFHDTLKFYRIDGENNDLPWEFTIDRYPSILFFPAYRKSDSRIYPQNLPVTVQNLVNFVLGNLGEGLSQIEGLFYLCSGWENLQDDISAKDCLNMMRSKSAEITSDTLFQYRTSIFRLRNLQKVSGEILSRDTQKTLSMRAKYLLFKLRTLKEIHLLLGSVNRLERGSSEFERIKKSLRMYNNYTRDKTKVPSFASHKNITQKKGSDQL